MILMFYLMWSKWWNICWKLSSLNQQSMFNVNWQSHHGLLARRLLNPRSASSYHKIGSCIQLKIWTISRSSPTNFTCNKLGFELGVQVITLISQPLNYLLRVLILIYEHIFVFLIHDNHQLFVPNPLLLSDTFNLNFSYRNILSRKIFHIILNTAERSLKLTILSEDNEFSSHFCSDSRKSYAESRWSTNLVGLKPDNLDPMKLVGWSPLLLSMKFKDFEGRRGWNSHPKLS